MSGPWLASYIVLWGVVLFQGVAIFVLLRQLGIMYLGTAQGVARDGLAPGSKAPDFIVEGIDGRPLSLAGYRGRSLLLVFGSPTCGPCRALIPDLHQFAAERAAEIDVLFLSHGTTDDARRLAQELEIHVPVASHPDESLAEKYKARVTPFAFLIDGEGVVRAKGLANNHAHLEMLVQMAQGGKQGANGARRNGAPIELHTPEGEHR